MRHLSNLRMSNSNNRQFLNNRPLTTDSSLLALQDTLCSLTETSLKAIISHKAIISDSSRYVKSNNKHT